jgi:ribosomal protein L20
MPRATNNVAARARHRKLLKQAEGYYGAKSRLYRIAGSGGRGLATPIATSAKRDFRQLWIMRINAAARLMVCHNSFMTSCGSPSRSAARSGRDGGNDAGLSEAGQTAKQAQS